MKKGKVFFHPIEGSASLTISWSSGPKGDAVEAKKGSGVGFFSDKGDLLCVIFDEVQSADDQQTLQFTRDCVEITVKNGRVKYVLSQTKPRSIKPKKRVKIKQPV
ncbi:MAG: hypothetical protein HYX48_01590 [Chlamydiales bacterium]|nr:hypothetical protein [Chlamydiales bacterium]